MKILITILLTALTLNAFAQQEAGLNFPCTSISFEDHYRESNPTLKYSCDELAQIHNYSNNWDLDNDGIKDEVYFIGTGGAHLYYFLKVVLSKDKKAREFEFIVSDFPMLTATDTLNFEKTPIGFVVADMGKNQTPTIIVRLDNGSYYASKKIFRKKKINTKNISISFVNGKTKYGCL